MEDIDFEKILIYCNDIKKNMNKKINDFLKAYNITSVHAPYLLLLKKYNALTMNELNQLLNVDKANTTRVICYLKLNKMVMKTEEIRKYKIKLTEYGNEVANHIESNIKNINDSIKNSIEKEKLNIFNEVLNEIVKKLKGE